MMVFIKNLTFAPRLAENEIASKLAAQKKAGVIHPASKVTSLAVLLI